MCRTSRIIMRSTSTTSSGLRLIPAMAWYPIQRHRSHTFTHLFTSDWKECSMANRSICLYVFFVFLNSVSNLKETHTKPKPAQTVTENLEQTVDPLENLYFPLLLSLSPDLRLWDFASAGCPSDKSSFPKTDQHFFYFLIQQCFLRLCPDPWYLLIWTGKEGNYCSTTLQTCLPVPVLDGQPGASVTFYRISAFPPSSSCISSQRLTNGSFVCDRGERAHHSSHLHSMAYIG